MRCGSAALIPSVDRVVRSLDVVFQKCYLRGLKRNHTLLKKSGINPMLWSGPHGRVCPMDVKASETITAFVNYNRVNVLLN